MADTKKIQNVEFLRILFTCCICIQHFFYVMGVEYYACLAVEFFFILSGFLLVYTFTTKKTVASFLKSKIVRFVPVIFMVAVVCGILITLLWHSDAKSAFSFTRLIADSLFLPFPGLIKQSGYVSISWYISILFWVLLFYFYLMKYWRAETVHLIVALIVFFSYVILASTTWDRLASVNIFLKVNLLRGLGGVGMGYLLATYIYSKPLPILPKRYMYSILEVFFLCFSVVALFNKTVYPGNPLYLVLSFTVLLYLFIVNRGAVSQYLNQFQWSNFSKYALSLYLGQEIVIFVIYKYLVIFFSDWMKENVMMVLGIVILGCMIVSWWLYHYVEEPCGLWLKKFLDGEYVQIKKSRTKSE